MKKITPILLSAFVLATSATALIAAPRSISNSGKDYIIGVSRLANWSCGAYYDSRERDITVRDSWFEQSLNTDALGAYVGYDFRWLTAYGLFGSTESSIEGSNYEPPQTEYGVGMRFGLIDQEILDPTLFEDRLRLNAFVQYTENKSKWIEWQEISGAITLSLVNDIHGYKMYAPEAIALFLGPAFSDMRGNVNESENVGLLAGIDFFLTHKVSAYIQMTSWGDDNSNTTGLGVNVTF